MKKVMKFAMRESVTSNKAYLISSIYFVAV